MSERGSPPRDANPPVRSGDIPAGVDEVVQEATDRFERCVNWEKTARARFLDDFKFANADASLRHIVTEAWTFGHYDTIARVAKLLEKTTSAEKAEVETAVSKALKQMAKERAGTPRRANV